MILLSKHFLKGSRKKNSKKQCIHSDIQRLYACDVYLYCEKKERELLFILPVITMDIYGSLIQSPNIAYML